MLSAVVHFPGRLLFSGTDTICPGDLYVMLLNPGGEFTFNPRLDETIGFTLAEVRKGWSYYDDEAETPGARLLQARVRGVFEGLDRKPANTLITNAVFVRAADEDAFGEVGLNFWQLWWNLCWPVHQVLLDVVKPKLVVCFGEVAYAAIGSPYPQKDRRPETWPDPADPSRPKRWLLDLGSEKPFETAVLELPHPSSSNNRQWAGDKLNEGDQKRLAKAKELLE